MAKFFFGGRYGIENDLSVLKWMVATVIALSLAGFGTGLTLLFRILSSLPHTA